MAGYITEFFGYCAEDLSQIAKKAAKIEMCPFTESPCAKVLSRDGLRSGVCAVRQKTSGSPSVICCPNRIYADNYKILHDISWKAFGVNLNLYAGRIAVEKAKMENGAVAVFGHGWGGELHLPQRKGMGSYFVDWILAIGLVARTKYQGFLLNLLPSTLFLTTTSPYQAEKGR